MVTALTMYFETSKIMRHPAIHVIVVNSNLFEAVGDTQIYSGMQTDIYCSHATIVQQL